MALSTIVAIYNRALSQEEIREHHAKALAGTGYGIEFMAVAEPGLEGDASLILDGSKSSASDGSVDPWQWASLNRDPQGI